mmetsp:Transcript_28057/g.74020  ORF Transcript_28057/g.74020 Transcript_28057/m.74020 type:complete len:133 (-) Transcript_28057:670-1068(-)
MEIYDHQHRQEHHPSLFTGQHMSTSACQAHAAALKAETSIKPSSSTDLAWLAQAASSVEEADLGTDDLGRQAMNLDIVSVYEPQPRKLSFSPAPPPKIYYVADGETWCESSTLNVRNEECETSLQHPHICTM